MTQRYANAPVTWGVWGAHTLPPGRTAADILAAVAGGGYDGIELGPLGLLGTRETLPSTLAQHGLALAGAYVPIRFTEGIERITEDFEVLEEVCQLVETTDRTAPIILAEETIDEIKRHLARGTAPSDLDLDRQGWRRLVAVLGDAQAVVEGHGLTASFHPHAGTHIEQPHEVDRLLGLSDVALTLDTGHAAIGGDDPINLLRRWAERVNHVHLKDIRMSMVRKARGTGEIFGIAAAAAPLGAGDLDLRGLLAALDDIGYSGWVVVEQDRRPDGGHDHAQVDLEQAHNREWISMTSRELSQRRRTNQ